MMVHMKVKKRLQVRVHEGWGLVAEILFHYNVKKSNEHQPISIQR